MNSEINIKNYLPETNFDLNLISDYFEKNMIMFIFKKEIKKG